MIGLFLDLCFRSRQFIQSDFDHLRNVVPVGGRNRNGCTQSKLVKIGCDARTLHPLGFVHQQQERTPGLTQLGGDDAVLRSHPIPTVDDEQHHIRLVHCLSRLLGHLVQDTFFGHRLQTAGINHQKWPFADAAATIVTVACQSRQVCHQRITATREAIEQRGFSDVGAADKNESR